MKKSHTILCILADTLVSIYVRSSASEPHNAARARAFVCIKHARLTDFAETFGYLLFRPRPETNNPEMWKTALLSLAVALSTAQGTLAGIMSTYQWKLSHF